MALDFPSNPVDGQVYDNYFWDAPTNAWRSSGSTSIPDFLKNATISTASLADVPLRIDGVASQTANLQEWRNSGGTVLSSMSASGGLTLNNALTVANGGTGATSLTSGAYLKGNGANAIQAQTGIPASDVTSGRFDVARMPAGSVIQVKSTTVTAAATYSMGAGAIQDVGVNVSITPTSASSKIFIISTVSSAGVSFNRPGSVLIRNGSRIAIGDAAGSRNRTSSGGSAGETSPGTQTVNFLDSPNTTSALTYGVYIVNYHSATQTYNFNYDQGNSDNVAHGRTASTITVMEIAG